MEATTGVPDHPCVACDRLRAWLNDRCGMHYAEHKTDVLMQRLARVMNDFHIPSLEDLSERVERGTSAELITAVIHAASTNHTYFYRETEVLDYFSDQILAPRAGQETRIWSAAASTGDEAYTCAIITSERFGRATSRAQVYILGTDISAPVLQTAESGVYGAVHLEQTPKDIVDRYFVKEGPDAWRVTADIREMCMFRRLNLKATPYPFQRRFHVVFCRNVLYYFDMATQRDVVEAIYEVTEPGGYLLTSVTVSLRELSTRWRMIQSGVYRKPVSP